MNLLQEAIQENSFIQLDIVDSLINTGMGTGTNTFRLGLDSSILQGNCLIFGASESYNQDLALAVQSQFLKKAKLAKIIDFSKFLSLSDYDKKDRNVSYIIICDQYSCAPIYLKRLQNFVETKLFFRIAGLKWKDDECGQVSVSKEAKDILDICGINDLIGRGILASLEEDEFCVLKAEQVNKCSGA